jgi:hypothetical protein
MPSRRVLTLAAVVLLLGVSPALGQPTVDRADVRLDIRADAVVVVSESIGFHSSEARPAASRTIALHALDGGLVRVDDLTATDVSGRSLRVDVAEHDGAIRARTLDRLTGDGPRRFQVGFAYHVANVLRAEPGRHRLDWVVAAPQWVGHLPRLAISVTLPPSLPRTADVRASLAQAFRPVHARVVRTPRGVDVVATALKPRDGVVLTVTWPAGHVNLGTAAPAEPSAHAAATPWLVPGVLSLVCAAIAIGRRRARGPIVPIYSPPTTLRAGEAGVVIDGTVDDADVLGAIADLAVRGYLGLEPLRRPGDTDVFLTITRPWRHDREIRPFEAVLLARTFHDGATTARLSGLRHARDTWRSIKEHLSADLVERGVFPESPRAVARAGGWLGVIVLGGWSQVAWNAGSAWPTFLAGAATAVVVWMLVSLVASDGLTAEGRATRQQLLGFREFLRRVDKDRLERLAPGTLDPNLPWAIALGVTAAWMSVTAQD